ncbi:MAG: histidinol dehydrogenase, partial [Lysobacterales bacterium]
MSTVRRFATHDGDFEDRFRALLKNHEHRDAGVEKVVRDIIEDVRQRGDAALLDYTRTFDGLAATSADALRVDDNRMRAAFGALDGLQRGALEFAAERI